eukprot:scaffold12640_cov106-Isochrysis_galbana.AAC.7
MLSPAATAAAAAMSRHSMNATSACAYAPAGRPPRTGRCRPTRMCAAARAPPPPPARRRADAERGGQRHADGGTPSGFQN